MQPIVHGLEAKYRDRILFTSLDIDDPKTASIKQALGYRVQPDFFLLDAQGHVVKQWLGAVTAEEIVGAFDSILK